MSKELKGKLIRLCIILLYAAAYCLYMCISSGSTPLFAVLLTSNK